MAGSILKILVGGAKI